MIKPKLSKVVPSKKDKQLAALKKVKVDVEEKGESKKEECEDDEKAGQTNSMNNQPVLKSRVTENY